MELPDLHEFPKGHPPSPYGKPALVVKVGDGILPQGLILRAVGWLESQEYPTGTVPKECIDVLVAALRGGIIHDGLRGTHTCTLCGRDLPDVRWKRRKIAVYGHGHYLVQMGQVVYMAPRLLLHYILGHKYRPPEEFLEAVTMGRFLTNEDLEVKWRSQGEEGAD